VVVEVKIVEAEVVVDADELLDGEDDEVEDKEDDGLLEEELVEEELVIVEEEIELDEEVGVEMVELVAVAR
jgi:hypothetical protein